MGEDTGKYRTDQWDLGHVRIASTRPKPIDHRIEKQPFNLCALGEAVFRSLECVDQAAAVGCGCGPSQKGA